MEESRGRGGRVVKLHEGFFGDGVILNYGQVTWTTPELAPPPNYHTTPTGGRFSSTDLACIAALHGGSLVGTSNPFRYYTTGYRGLPLTLRAKNILFVRLVDGEERPLTLPQGILPQNWGRTELNRTFTCRVFKAASNDRPASSPLP
ncbi:hypothetical protein TNCV_5015161 [Trichonephila clavipes]|nr:hypothetical protein TNCV_5015161 [Trichonephila clavipes]